MFPDQGRHKVVFLFDDEKADVGDIRDALVKGGFKVEGEPVWLDITPSLLAELQKSADEKVLVGGISKDELFRTVPAFRENTEKYEPKPNIVKRIAAIDTRLHVVMFLGTWCKDSIEQSPKLIKTLKEAGNSNLTLDIYGVDREKKDQIGLAEKYRIERVPTIIVFEDGGIEKGRIVEHPHRTMEEDFLVIAEDSDQASRNTPRVHP